MYATAAATTVQQEKRSDGLFLRRADEQWVIFWCAATGGKVQQDQHLTRCSFVAGSGMSEVTAVKFLHHPVNLPAGCYPGRGRDQNLRDPFRTGYLPLAGGAWDLSGAVVRPEFSAPS